LPTLEQARASRGPPRVQTSQGQELVLVAPGRFRMGSSRREPGRRSNETLREVEITRPYYLAASEVSNRDFREFRPEHRSGSVGGHSLEADHHPVVRVSWQDAAAYCNWLSRREGLAPAYVEGDGGLVPAEPPTAGYRLPSEAEWAWAARYSGEEGPLRFPWGASLPVPEGAGNYADSSADDFVPATIPDFDDGHPASAPVASFRSNARGLRHLGGNVAEWVDDRYTIYPPSGSGAAAVERDPRGPAAGELHVIRGASYLDSSISDLRLSRRDYGDEGRPDLGFRIARAAE
jgi:formylglycine-generating enzyme required for sulfatase activity